MQNPEIFQWVRTNSDNIANQLLAHRKYLIAKDKADKTDKEFDLARFELSEMGLCVAINSIKLPNGYTSTKGAGRVKVNGGRERFHVFAVNNDEVLCFTPGWFFAEEGQSNPGSAIRPLISKAPELFIPTETIIALNGNRDYIKQKIGLEYIWPR